MPRVRATRPIVAAFISPGARSGPVPAAAGSGGASSGSPQKTFDQIFVIEYRVSRLTARLTPVTAHSPALKPAATRATLPKNPENGGRPARLIAASRNMVAVN